MIQTAKPPITLSSGDVFAPNSVVHVGPLWTLDKDDCIGFKITGIGFEVVLSADDTECMQSMCEAKYKALHKEAIEKLLSRLP